MVNEDKLNTLLGQVIGDLGAAYSVSLVRLGDRLGLYKAVHEGGPATSDELPARTGLNARYLREWTAQQAASNYLEYDGATGRFTLPLEHAMVFVDPNSPVYLMGGFDNMLATIENEPKVEAGFRSGDGVAWGDRDAVQHGAGSAGLVDKHRAGVAVTAPARRF